MRGSAWAAAASIKPAAAAHPRLPEPPIALPTCILAPRRAATARAGLSKQFCAGAPPLRCYVKTQARMYRETMQGGVDILA